MFLNQTLFPRKKNVYLNNDWLIIWGRETGNYFSNTRLKCIVRPWKQVCSWVSDDQRWNKCEYETWKKENISILSNIVECEVYAICWSTSHTQMISKLLWAQRVDICSSYSRESLSCRDRHYMVNGRGKQTKLTFYLVCFKYIISPFLRPSFLPRLLVSIL